MSSMQSPPMPPPMSRGMSPVAINSTISSVVTFAGVVLVMISGGFVYLASYILRSALLMQPISHDVREMIPVYMVLAIIPSVCAIITFIFGLRIVARGLGRLMQQGTSPGASV